MTQHYLLPCSCGQKTRVALSQAGGQVVCTCGKRLGVPTMRGIRQLELAPREAIKKQLPGWSRMHGALFATGLFFAAVGMALIAFYLLRCAQIGGLAVDRSADVTKAMSADIDRLTPVQTLDLWSNEILKDGLGEAQTPIWVAAKGKLNEYLWWIKLGASAVVAGILLSVGTLFVRRPSR